VLRQRQRREPEEDGGGHGHGRRGCGVQFGFLGIFLWGSGDDELGSRECAMAVNSADGEDLLELQCRRKHSRSIFRMSY
jgi:hypothetical protein